MGQISILQIFQAIAVIFGRGILYNLHDNIPRFHSAFKIISEIHKNRKIKRKLLPKKMKRSLDERHT